MSAVRLSGVSKAYRRPWSRQRVEALREVSLEVGEGEVFGFVGPNGAGKSTTIKVMIGAIQPDGGSATLFGVDVSLPVARRAVAYVPENPSLPGYLTPLEILLMAQRIYGRSSGDIERICLDWLHRFGLGSAARRVIKGFSKGMMQRTALAHALALSPRLLILDEPLSGLDPVGRRDVVEILLEYRKQGGTIFLTSHVLHDVERLADRFGFINQGKLLTIQSPGALLGERERFTVRSVGGPPVHGMTEERPSCWVGQFERNELWAVLERLRQGGHQLAEVRPALTLETAFFQYLGKSPPTPHQETGD